MACQFPTISKSRFDNVELKGKIVESGVEDWSTSRWQFSLNAFNKQWGAVWDYTPLFQL
jgi:hypothetical protein